MYPYLIDVMVFGSPVPRSKLDGPLEFCGYKKFLDDDGTQVPLPPGVYYILSPSSTARIRDLVVAILRRNRISARVLVTKVADSSTAIAA